jgi:hypothetical protein
MKANKFLLAAALVLALFFLSQFAAEMANQAGPKPDLKKTIKQPALDLKMFSLSSQPYTETAYAMLEAGAGVPNGASIKISISLLRNALRRNPLDYQAHYYLAKAYLQVSAMGNDYFDLGVTELKRAARIRGSNSQIALDCAKVFFSLWPLLEDEDKAFVSELLAEAMPALSWPQFSPLVELWSLYVQDSPLLMELLQRKPEFFGPVADQLVAAAIPIKQRRELLALDEVHTLDDTERRWNESALQGEMGLDAATVLLNQLRRLKGYYRLQHDKGFSVEKLAKLERALLLDVISGLLKNSGAQADSGSASKIRELILTYIAEHSDLNSLDELQKLLEEKKYFKDNDFSSLYLKILITFKKGSYSDIIGEIEALRKTISFVTKEQSADYTAILLLLVDSYYSNKLMTAAESVARELYENQPDNPDVLWRVLRVQSIMGSEGPQDPILKEKLIAVQNSRFVTIAKPNVTFDVFLFNQPWIEITMDPALLAQLKPKQLVQVFVDGKIAFENYADGLPQKIAIGPPFVGIESKVKVQVIVL